MKDPSVIYDKAFFEEPKAYRHQYDRLGECIHAILGGPSTVFDVGCGAAFMIARLADLGHDVCGIDGSEHGIAAVPASIRSRVALRDITTGSPPGVEADVVICTEVAEHLEAEHADRLVDLVTRSARRTIVWSAAPPGQGGVDHVNEQPPEYWLDLFAAKCWVPDEVTTKAIRILMWEWKAQHCYAKENFWVLRRTIRP